MDGCHGKKNIIGIFEKVIIHSASGEKTVMAKIDTGASKSSIDVTLAASLQLGPVIKSKRIRNAHGSNLREVIEVNIILAGNKTKCEFTLADRSHMKYPIIIGQNTLKKGCFLIDPLKTNKTD